MIEVIDTRRWFDEFIHEPHDGLRAERLEENVLSEKFGISPETLYRFGMFTAQTDLSYVKDAHLKFEECLVFDKIPNWIEQAQQQLDPLPVRVALLLLDQKMASFYERMRYATAHTASQNTILCYASPVNNEEWLPMLESLCYHEYNHLMRNHLRPLEKPQTLLDLLVSEGLAEAFVSQVLGSDRVGPWAQMPADLVTHYWPRYQNVLESSDILTLQSYLFGDTTQDLPEWLGYSVGYQLVKAYWSAHPKLSMRELLALPSQEFLSSHV